MLTNERKIRIAWVSGWILDLVSRFLFWMMLLGTGFFVGTLIFSYWSVEATNVIGPSSLTYFDVFDVIIPTWYKWTFVASLLLTTMFISIGVILLASFINKAVAWIIRLCRPCQNGGQVN